MEPQSIALVESILNAIITFTALYFEAILATFIFLLGYSLLRVGLEKLPPTGSREVSHYAKSIIPGGAFVLLAIVIFAGQDPLLLALFLLVLTVGAGFGFVGIGYQLLVKGVFQADDKESVWSDGRMLIGRGAPGVVLALVGVFMIADGLLSAPEDFRGYSAERLEARLEMGEVVDARLTEVLALFRDPGPSPAETPVETD